MTKYLFLCFLAMVMISVEAQALVPAEAKAPIQEKTGRVQVSGGKIWYKVFSTPKTAKETPLIIIHGGPGGSHNYILPLKKFALERPVIFYDQLGCGQSKKFNPATPKLWTIERFTDELHSLIGHLGYSKVLLLGHSWGTSLAFDYYQKHPEKVAKLIFAGSFFSAKVWQKDADYLRAQLPKATQLTLDKCEKANTWKKPECDAAVTMYYKRYLNRQDPWPKDLVDSFAAFGEEVYLAMNGPNEFITTGSLKDYDVTEELKNIQVPTLFLSGEFDEVRPETTRDYASRVKNSTVKIFANRSHTSHLEDTDEFVHEVSRFLVQ